MPTVFIGIPTTGTIPMETVAMLFKLAKRTNVEVVFAKSCLVQENRNELVDMAKAWRADYIFFVDSDMVFDDNVLDTLLKADKDIIACDYNKRQIPLEGMCRDIKGDLIDTKGRGFAFKCGYIGTGCMLIKMSVFKKLEKPYFNFVYENGKFVKGEDHYFCDMARKAGYDVWCEPTVRVKHLGNFLY